MTPEETASWKPLWPLKVVSSDADVSDNRKVAGLARISIVPATDAGTTLPFDQGSALRRPDSRRRRLPTVRPRRAGR